MGNILFWTGASGFLSGVGYTSLIPSWWHVCFAFVLCLASVGCLAVVKQRSFLCLCLFALMFSVGGVRTLAAPSELPPSFVPLLDQRSTFEGVLVAQPDRRETSARLLVEVSQESPLGEINKTRIIAVASAHGMYTVGDQVKVSGTLSLPEPFAADGGRTFRYDKFLAKDGVFGIVQPAHVEVIGKSSSPFLFLMRPLQAARDGFMRAIGRALPEPESALAAGLIVGGKQGLGKELLDDFTVAGLLPIVVLSGYNVMIIAEGILRSLSFLPKRSALSLAAISITLFVLAAGAGASSIRAGLMALMALLARATGRTYAVVRALFITLVLMVLWSPFTLIFDPGLQFSFIATIGLIIGNPIIQRRLLFIRNDFMRDIIASTLAAQVGVLPLLLYQTGNLSLVSVVANIFVLPVIPAAMALSGIAAAVAYIPGAALEPLILGIGLPAYVLLMYIISVAEFSAQLPLAAVIIPSFSFWIVVAAYVVLAAIVLCEHKKNRPAAEAAGLYHARTV